MSDRRFVDRCLSSNKRLEVIWWLTMPTHRCGNVASPDSRLLVRSAIAASFGQFSTIIDLFCVLAIAPAPRL